MNVFRKLKAMLILREAIKLANEIYTDNPQRYFVMPTTDGKLSVMTKKEFRTLKRKHYINKEATNFDLMRECFYFTPDRGGNDAITDDLRKRKSKQYMRWCEAYTKMKSMRKKQ